MGVYQRVFGRKHLNNYLYKVSLMLIFGDTLKKNEHLKKRFWENVLKCMYYTTVCMY